MKAFFKTSGGIVPLILRLVLAVVFFAHGSQKVFGWFGGHGFSGTMQFFTENMHIPAVFAFLAIAAEFGGSIGLFLGFLTRLCAFGIGMVMIVAIITVHATNGFFMNWSGQQAGEGFEYHLLALAIALALLIKGGGRWSIDAVIAAKMSGVAARSAVVPSRSP